MHVCGYCPWLPTSAIMRSNSPYLHREAQTRPSQVRSLCFIPILISLCLYGDVAAECTAGSFIVPPELQPNVVERSADNSTEYWFFATPVTWCAAEASCQAHGGHLASLLTTAENELVLNACFNKLLSTAPTGGCWIGLNDQATEGQYEWSDGSPFYFEDWFRGQSFVQPDDQLQEHDEDCTFAFKAYQGWHDRACDASYAYVCKVPAIGTATDPVQLQKASPGMIAPSPQMQVNPLPSPTAVNDNSSDEHSERWKTVVAIMVPILVGISAVVTIVYTGWKWWHKRQATLAKRKAGAAHHTEPWQWAAAGCVGRPVKPLTEAV